MSNPRNKTPGQVAYEAQPVPCHPHVRDRDGAWSSLSGPAQEHWERIAARVINHWHETQERPRTELARLRAVCAEVAGELRTLLWMHKDGTAEACQGAGNSVRDIATRLDKEAKVTT